MIREAKARALAAASKLAKAKNEFRRELRATRKALAGHPEVKRCGTVAWQVAEWLKICSTPGDFLCDAAALREEIIHADAHAADMRKETRAAERLAQQQATA